MPPRRCFYEPGGNCFYAFMGLIIPVGFDLWMGPVLFWKWSFVGKWGAQSKKYESGLALRAVWEYIGRSDEG